MIKEVEKKFYKKNGHKIKCLLCQHFCNLNEDQIGICGVNKNINGKLHNLVFGNLVAKNIDPIEKKPLYHFLPGTKTLSIGTIGCNMQCPFCQNWHISQVKKNIDSNLFISPEMIVNEAIRANCQSIAYTYNEPTIFYPYAKQVALKAKKLELKNIFVTNGIESQEVLEDMKGVIDGFNVDFKSINPSFYKVKLKAPFGILDTLEIIKKLGMWLEVTTLLIPGENDSKEELNQISSFISNKLGAETPWHISAFYPNFKMQNKQRTSRNTIDKAFQIGQKNGLKHIYKGNLGLKNITICPYCNKNLVERAGYHVYNNQISKGTCPNCNAKILGIWN